MSADVGLLDETALAGAFEEDPDGAIALLADLARATDRGLRDHARALAARLLLPPARHRQPGGTAGAVRLVRSKQAGLDLDLDATIDEVAGRAPGPDDLRWRTWQRPGRAYILLVDASGSVAGRPLTTAMLTAAALVGRLQPGDELAIVAFWSRVVVLRTITSREPPHQVLDALFDLRGGDTTDIAAALRAGLAEAAKADARRRDVIVLTDGLATAGHDPAIVAGAAAGEGTTIHVLALSADPEPLAACDAIAGAGGGRVAVLARPSDAPVAVETLLGGNHRL